jgi:hypothetical protein
VTSVAAPRSARPLYSEFLARVINIEAVQCHRAAATDDSTAQFLFFDAGCRPKLTASFLWSLDAPEEDFPGAPPGAPFDLVLNPISPPMQLAWDAAVAAFKEFIKALKNGELIANGVHPATGARHDLHPAEWTREGLILDVRNGDLFEGHYCIEHVRQSGNGESIEGRNIQNLRWSSITLRAAMPEQKPGRIDWDDLWKHEVARREQGSLPNKKDYLREAEARIKDRYGDTTVPPTELRRIKAALYRGDAERPKRPKRKQPKHTG